MYENNISYSNYCLELSCLMLSFDKSYIHAGLSDIPLAIVSRRLVSLSRDTLLSSLALLLKHQLGYSLGLIF